MAAPAAATDSDLASLAQIKLGNACLQRDEHDKALGHYHKAAVLDATNIVAFSNVAEVVRDKSNPRTQQKTKL